MARGGIGRPRAARGRAPAPPAVTRTAPPIRDSADLDWVTRCVVIALAPSVAIGIFNTGYQVNLALARAGAEGANGWRGAVLEALGGGFDPASLPAAVLHGLLYMAPVLIVALVVGGAWERLFATWRKREASQGLPVIALLFTLSLPPTVPLWQVALGMSFGIVVGREVFGGTGENFLNPVLVGLLTEKDCFRFMFAATYHREQGGRVSEFMSREVATIEAGTDIVDVAQVFLKSPYRRFPVVEGGRLVGLISRRDVLRAFQALW